MCRCAGVEIVAWGEDALGVLMQSPDRAQQIASLLAHLGFQPMEQNENDADAGLLTLSRNPAATRAKVASFNVSRRRLDELLQPLVWAAASIACLYGSAGGRPPASRLKAVLGAAFLILLFWDGGRIWGWKLEILPEVLRIRRRFRWSTIPWQQIRSVESVPIWARDQESVILKLASHTEERLGTFVFMFARNLRDRLRIEITKRKGVQQ